MRRRGVVVAGLVLLAAAVCVAVLLRMGHDDETPVGLTVGWGGGEGDPSCVYDASDHTVRAQITIDGRAPGDDGVTVTVTVTAYADENTSEPVGSTSRSVHVDGTVHQSLVVTIPVERAPFIDDDGITACARTVTY